MNIESLLKTNPRCFFSYTKSLRKSNNLPAVMRWGNHTSDNMKDTVNLFPNIFLQSMIHQIQLKTIP